MKRPDIFEYLNYRDFLREMFSYHKQKNKNFSYRYFSGKAGFSSPNFIKLVIDGDRNLANGSIAKVSKGFGLKKREREFFEYLVFMNQAESHDDKDYYYQKMMAMKVTAAFGKIEKAEYDYFSNWYYPVIREMVMFGNKKLTPEDIAGHLNPKITPAQAKKALKALTDLNLIKKNEDDTWETKEKAITTGPEVKSIVIANFHKEMIGLAKSSIDRFPSGQRDISALTLSVSSESIKEIKQRISVFRKELLEFACNEKKSDQVVQINFQLFPLTDKI